MQLDINSLGAMTAIMSTVGAAIVALNRMFISSLIQIEFEKFQRELQIVTLDVSHKFAELERRFVLAAVHEAKYEHLHDRYEEIYDKVKGLEHELREKQNEKQ